MPQPPLSITFKKFVSSEQASGIVLLLCTLASVTIANTPVGPQYLSFWETNVFGLSLTHAINDALMAVFFLLIGLELEREFYVGELSDLKSALLPVVAAVGGMLAPALIHYLLNRGGAAQAGFGIPMATDIAFALVVLTVLGNRIPPTLKVFVVAFAVIDDLGAILVIAAFYTASLSMWHFGGALLVFFALVVLNRFLRIMSVTPYLIGGALMWFLMFKSGIHATIAGVLLAFAIPFTAKAEDEASPSHRLEHLLHKPVAFIVLPVFALANTGVIIGSGWFHELFSANSAGITLGLVLGKPLGVTLFCLIAVTVGLCRLPSDLQWPHLVGAGLLGGIGFTMSIFITNLAFVGHPEVIDASKIAILLASLLAGILGYAWLRVFGKPGTTE
ncbi:MAG: Na+/H+ antiporter NhaA [Betaproteobacteria bacterium]